MKYITAKQYSNIKDIPRGRLTARFLVYTGAIILKDDSVLVCKPVKSKYDGYQFPGGKVLWSESIIECVHREVLEETGYLIKLENIVGIFQRDTGPEDEEFLRIIFKAIILKKKDKVPLDPGIKEVKYVKIKDILDGKVKMQSEQMKIELENAIKGTSYPLEVIGMYKW